MSFIERAVISFLADTAIAFDGAVIGVGLAFFAVKTLVNFKTTSSALKIIKNAPSVTVSDLRSLLSSYDQTIDTTKTVAIVRGVVQPKSIVSDSRVNQNVLVSHEANESAVIIQRTNRCIYNQRRGFFGWKKDLLSMPARLLKEQKASSLTTIPFILVDGVNRPQFEYLTVNLDGSTHSLPLTTVYHNLQHNHASPYTCTLASVGYEYLVGLVDEEKILPVGKEITAVGLVRLKDGNPEVMASKDLPFFLSHMSKDEMVAELDFETRVLWWSGIVIGLLATGVFGYAIVRNWNRWKMWKRRQQNLCVICSLEQRRSAYLPCGHLACCRQCSISIERVSPPKCPICRQMIISSVEVIDV